MFRFYANLLTRKDEDYWSEMIEDLFSIYFLLIIWFGFLVFTLLSSQLQSFRGCPRPWPIFLFREFLLS